MKNKILKRVGIAVLVLVLVVVLALSNVRYLLTQMISMMDLINDQSEISLEKGVEWFDDYYTIEYIDDKTIAIGEPRYWQRNYNYLIIGDEYALLFDSGSGIRDIEPVVRSLTSLPVISMVSHFHYDHVGSVNEFETTILADNQIIDQEYESNILIPSSDSFLGDVEKIEIPTIRVDEIVELYSEVDLGGRRLQVLPTPGHSFHSIALYDMDSEQLFIGDFMIPGLLMTHSLVVPDGNFEEFYESTHLLVDTVSESTKIYAAHAEKAIVPVMDYQDLLDLKTFVNENRESANFIPKFKEINDIMSIVY